MATELYSETFSGTSALGSDWETLSSNGLTIISGSAVASASSQFCTSCIKTATETFPADQYAEIVMDVYSTGGNDYPGVCVRGTTGFNGYWIRAYPTEYRLYEVTGNVESYIDDIASTLPVSGDTLRIEAEGTEIRVYLNSVLKITATGETAYASGQPGMVYWWGNNRLSHIDSFSAGNLSAAAGPVFDDTFSPITSKIGQVFGVGTEIDMSQYFSDADTITYVGTTLPAGMSIDVNTGLITGTLPTTAASFACTVTATAGGDATAGNFTWDYTDYSLVFNDTTKLLNTSNSPYNPATTVNFSAILGMIDDVAGLGAVDATVHDWSAETVTDGVVTLTNANLVAGTYTVFVQDVTDATILGVYEIVAE